MKGTPITRAELWIAFLGLIITILASVFSGGIWLGSMQASISSMQQQEDRTFSLVQGLLENPNVKSVSLTTNSN